MKKRACLHVVKAWAGESPRAPKRAVHFGESFKLPEREAVKETGHFG